METLPNSDIVKKVLVFLSGHTALNIKAFFKVKFKYS